MLPNNDNGPAPGADRRDGRAALSDRVRSLRLGDGSPDKRGGRAGFIPWAACAVLGMFLVFFQEPRKVTPAVEPVDPPTEGPP